MKTPILFLAAALALFVSACTTPPPVSGSVTNKFGTIRLQPDGRVELVIEPRSGK